MGRPVALDAARSNLSALHPVRLYERCEATAALLALNTLPDTPWLTMQRLPEIWRWRSNAAGIVVLGAARHPRRTAITDESGRISFGELERRTTAIAGAWRAAGMDENTTIGVLAGNGRRFVEANLAASKLGADTVYLNGAFSAPQVARVVETERISVLVHDEDHDGAVAQVPAGVAVDEAEMEQLATRPAPIVLSPPGRTGRVIVLTSGTTGHPRGAARSGRVSNPLDAAGIVTCIPFAPHEVSVVAAPMFHGLGLFMSNLTLALGGTLVLHRRFDPEQTLHDLARSRATVLVAVPIMLQRILELPARRLRMFDTSSLRIVVCGGAQLPGELAERFMERFGDVLYNVYGSTETALATVAAPRDLHAAPGTAGRPVPGTTVTIVDSDGRPAHTGVTGRVFVGSSFGFDGYTSGGGKEQIGSLISAGDLGHFDRWGRLFIDGREDDMIVSGGENVFPREVEEVLGVHPDVVEAAAVGVPDPDYGQRLRAFVVLREGATVTEEQLKAFVHDQLARFKTPREVVFLDSLPRTATGKVVKRKLRPA
jgi:acyl-CoA synthetase (AMP-forming)/AMP-acid ligase II